MGKKVVKTTKWTEKGKGGRTTEVVETKTCGTVCHAVKTTAKVAGAVAVGAVAIGVLASKGK